VRHRKKEGEKGKERAIIKTTNLATRGRAVFDSMRSEPVFVVQIKPASAKRGR